MREFDVWRAESTVRKPRDVGTTVGCSVDIEVTAFSESAREDAHALQAQLEQAVAETLMDWEESND